MSDFQAFHAVTHPIIRLADDWNNLLGHGLVKPASYIIRKNGVDYEAIDGNTGNKFLTNTNAATVIQGTFDQIQTLGGGTAFFKTGTYTLTTGLIKPPMVNIDGEGNGTILLMDAGIADYAIEIATNYGAWSESGSITNIVIVGTNAALGGIHLVDCFNQKIDSVVIIDFTAGFGIQLDNHDWWTEGYVLSNLNIRNCLVGIDFINTGGTESFSYGYIGPYWIAVDPVNGIGVNIPDSCDFVRSYLDGVCWISDPSQTGVIIGGECGDSILDFSVETFNFGTGLVVQSTAWLGTCRRIEPRFIGTFTTEIDNATSELIYSVHEQPAWIDEKLVVNSDDNEAISVWKASTGSHFFNINSNSKDIEITNGGYMTMWTTGFTAANIAFQLYIDGGSPVPGASGFLHSLQPLTALPGHAADTASGLGTATYPWVDIYGTTVHGTDYMTGANTGIDQSMTIADNNGTHYHHLTFTSGLLTAYVYDTNP